MFEAWKVLHLDEVEAESILFCRALSQESFAGHCESVRSIADAQLHLERAIYTPQVLARPDLIVINWHSDGGALVLDFVHWIRDQPQFRSTPVIVFITAKVTLEAQERAQSEGVTEMIVRTDNFEDLRDKVRALLLRHMSRYAVQPAPDAPPTRDPAHGAPNR